MMRSRTLSCCLVLLACLAVLGGWAPMASAADTNKIASEADPKLLLKTVRANRRALVAVNLNLSAEEAAKFWPLYDKYQAEVSAVGDRMLAIVDDYTQHFADLPNDKALQMVTDYLAAEAERVKVRQTYLPEFAKILPGRTVARFYQLDNKMDAVIRYDLAASIPVIEQKAAH